MDLTHVIDTSGAYIPGHGTPTVILFGRTLFPRRGSTIRAVLGVRGEVGVPDDPPNGPVWSAIVTQVDQPGSESEWVSVVDLHGLVLPSIPGASAVVAQRSLTALFSRDADRLASKISAFVA